MSLYNTLLLRALCSGSQLPPPSQLPQLSMHLVSNSRQPNLPCPLLVLPGLLRERWFPPLATLARCSPGSSCQESGAWSGELLGVGREGKGTSGRMFWPYAECIHISILVWKIFCSAALFLEVCIEIMCAAPPGGPSRSTVCSLCFQSVFLCSWIFPNPSSASGLWPQTEENSVMNAVNLKLIIVSKVNNGKTDYQQTALLRTQLYRDLMFPLTKQCHSD